MSEIEKGYFKIEANTPVGTIIVEGNGFSKSRSERNKVADDIHIALSNMIDAELYKKVKILMNPR